MKIMIVDDHPMFRDAIMQTLEQLDDTLHWCHAGSCEEAFSLCEEQRDFDLVLLDLDLPGMDGLTGLNEMRQRLPTTPVVILSATDDRDYVMRAIEQGAKGYIPKSSSGEVLLNALRLILSGGVYLPMAVLDGVYATAAANAEDTPSTRLTPRQIEVLNLLSQGKMNKEISNALGMAENTVRVHVRAILDSLGVSNRTEAALRAMQLGLVTESEG
ncbi:hypothetical protein MNBD_GAMMA06-1316 [hydrothermal vent metagenome]|uniref:Two-component transcriptional response regulator, LuxR family n=1 Tax=hydrothermal vent metagenome TaxID=652676 RepID=A0A3B0XE30_9ZZZZ